MFNINQYFIATSLIISAMVNSVTTTNFVPNILDPSVFDIPPECLALR
jgi:hypothetical protein